MALGADRYASRADTLVFLGCVLLSAAAMSLPGRLRDPLAGTLRRTVLAPFLSLQQQIERLSASLARYDAVVAQRDSAALVATFLPELRGENARLRSLLGLGTRRRHAARHPGRRGGGCRGRGGGVGAHLPAAPRRASGGRHPRHDPGWHDAGRPAVGVRSERGRAVRRSDKYRFYVILAVLVVLQFSARRWLGGDRVAPDFLLLALLIYTIRARPGPSAVAGFVVGLVRDALTPASFG